MININTTESFPAEHTFYTKNHAAALYRYYARKSGQSVIKFGLTMLFSLLLFNRITSASVISTEPENLNCRGYCGIVYTEITTGKNSPGLREGIPGVAVTDGLNVVVTDRNGRFELPGNSRTRFITVTVPAGYKTSGKHYIKADPSVGRYDFRLVPHPVSAAGEVRFVQLADTETFEDRGWIQPVRDYAANEEISFIIHTGDICYERGMNFHGRNVTTETMGVPVFYCVGNHDLVKGNYGEELFENIFGPVYYSFEAGNTHFIVTPMPGGDFSPSYTREDVYRWLKNDLKHVDPSKNIVVFNHFMQLHDKNFVYEINENEKIDLIEHNLKAWIYGHHHSNYMKQHGSSGVVSVQSSPPDKGGINHSPSNFLVHSINQSGELKVTPRYNYLSSHISVLSPHGENVAVDQDRHMIISVNVYDTKSETESVEVQLNGNPEWISLQKNTDWNWSGTYPFTKLAGYRTGRILARATLSNGDVFTGVRNFVCTPDEAGTVDAAHDLNRISGSSGYGGLTLEWVANAGSNIWMCSPVCSDGLVFVAAYDDFDREKNNILAFDAIKGDLKWKYQTGFPVKNRICISDGIVLATDQEGIAHALDAASGELIWKKELGRNTLTPFISGGVVNNGIYYTGYGDYLTAIDVRSGTVLWKNSGWNGGFGTTGSYSLAGSTLIVGANWQALFGHDIATGEQKWSVEAEGMRFRSATSAWFEDTLYVPALKGIARMDPCSGNLFSFHPVPYSLQVATTLLVTDKLIVTGTSAEGLVAFDRVTLEEVWKVRTGASLVYTSPYSKPPAATVESAPVIAGNYIVFGASDGFLYVVDPESGTVVQKIELGAPVFGNATIEGDLLFIADFSGNIAKYKMAGMKK